MSAPPFEHLLTEQRERVYRYLVVLAGPHDAADCFQDTVLAALRAYPPRDSTNLAAWLFAIAHNKAIDGHRARARRPTPVPDPDPGAHTPSLPDHELWDAVALLPDKQRAAITLRFAADLPFAQVGDVVGCTEAAARQNVRAGLTRLRTILREGYDDADE